MMNLPKQKGSKTPSRRTRAYDLPGMRPLPFPQDSIRDIENEVLRDLSEEYRVLRLEQMIEKRKREMNRMREGSLDSGSLPSNTDMLNMAKFLSELSPEEAQRVRSSYAFFKMADKGGSGGMQLLPMLLNYAKTNPGASENQMINYLKLMDTQFSKGLEIAKAVNPKQGDPMNYMVKGMELMKAANPPKQSDPMNYMVKGMELMKATNSGKQNDPMEFLKLMKDLVIEGVRNPLMQAIKESQPTPGVWDQIMMKPELFNRMKDMGVFGGGSAATGQLDLEIEKLRGERELSMKKMDLEWRKSMLVRESEDRRTDALMSALTPLSMLFAGPLDQRMKQFGRQQAAGHNPGGMPPMGNTVIIRCPCGYQGTKTFPDAMPSSFSCPQCGGDLIVGGAPGAGNPENSPDSRPSSEGRDIIHGVDEK